jgi:hypothetical protein
MNALLDYRFWFYLGLLLTFVYIALKVLDGKRHKRPRREEIPPEGRLEVKRVDEKTFQREKHNLKPSQDGNIRTVRFGVDADGNVMGEFENPVDIHQAIESLVAQRRKASSLGEIKAYTIAMQQLLFKLEKVTPPTPDKKLSIPHYISILLELAENARGKAEKRRVLNSIIDELNRKKQGESFHDNPVEHTWFLELQGRPVKDLNTAGKLCDVRWFVPEDEFVPMSIDEVIELVKVYEKSV